MCSPHTIKAFTIVTFTEQFYAAEYFMKTRDKYPLCKLNVSEATVSFCPKLVKTYKKL